ncbi:gamma-glutamyl-gamma-aminobutyrate hydrolase family protein, partial [Rhizobium johnstonii]
MARPVIGIIGNARIIESLFSTQLVGEYNLRAVADVSEALPSTTASRSAISASLGLPANISGS